jgi:uncharacterized caspase-like protein
VSAVSWKTPSRALLLLGLAAALAGCAAGPPAGDVGTRRLEPPVERPGAEPAPVAATEAAGGRKHAVVIGVSRYANLARSQWLRFARADAEAVCDRFVDEAGLAIAPAQVKLLLDEGATRGAILAALAGLNDAAAAADTVIVYFAGHGTVDLGPGGELRGNYLLPYDAALAGAEGARALDPKTGIAVAEVQQILQVNPARNVLLVLDACFSGSSGRSILGARLDARQAERSERDLEFAKDALGVRAVLTATAPNQPALEIAALGHGLFTYYFLEALRADENRDGQVTLGEAYEYLFRHVREEARKQGVEQTPTKKGDDVGVLKLCDLPRTRYRVSLEVAYDGAPPLAARAAAPDEAVPVAAPGRLRAKVDAWNPPAPLYVDLVKIARTASGVRSALLLPDGENAAPPAVTVAEGRDAVYPDADFGAPSAPVPAAERDAHVLYVCIASEEEIARALVVEVERRLCEAAAAGDPDGLARRVAQAVEAEPALKSAAIRYAFVRHGRGAGRTIEVGAPRGEERPR